MNDILDRFLATPAVSTAGLGLVLILSLLWIAAAWWAHADMARRTDDEVRPLLAAAWIVVSTPALLVLALPIYLAVRPIRTVVERRTQDLAGDLETDLYVAHCPACDRRVESEWRRCPECATWLALPCAACGGWAPNDAGICPWCAGPLRRPDVAALAPYQPALATVLAPTAWPPAPSMRPAAGFVPELAPETGAASAWEPGPEPAGVRGSRRSIRSARPQAAPRMHHHPTTRPGPGARRLRRSGTPGAGARKIGRTGAEA